MDYKIGVIGCGFVGKAVAAGFSLHVDSVKMYDKYNQDYDSLEETVKESDLIFLCVPTPTNSDWTQDLSELDTAIECIVGLADTPKKIIIKSTVLPGTTRNYARKYIGHSFIFNPEFLSARIARFDFINPSRIILGGEPGTLGTVAGLYYHRFGDGVPIFLVEWEEAELVKYTANTFFAMKIAFFNEIYDIAQYLNVPYTHLKDMVLTDGKIANSHCDVPGHDGKRGYGGTCFPKDVKAFLRWAGQHKQELQILHSVNMVNDKIRGEKCTY